jgi:hypothetical protein
VVSSIQASGSQGRTENSIRARLTTADEVLDYLSSYDHFFGSDEDKSVLTQLLDHINQKGLQEEYRKAGLSKHS